LWVIDFDYPTRLHHGATLRYVNYARELQSLGHTVYFAGQFNPKWLEESRHWFGELRQHGIITDFFELQYRPTRWRARLAAATVHPSLANCVLSRFQSETTRMVKQIISNFDVDAVLLSHRRFWFLADTLMAIEPIVIDICDCFSLSTARELKLHLRALRFGRAGGMLWRFVNTVIEERYYARRGNATIVASPVDQRALRQISGATSHVKVLLNGVSFPPQCAPPRKVKNRLIFSGNMDFPPNYSAALWFLNHVFPTVLRQVPDAQFVIAGANPPAFVRQRAASNVIVTGYLEDLNSEIARSSLYVVPMVSGGGFKNKVVEAIVNRTFIVATPMALEFLDPDIRKFVAVAESASEMADTIVRLLRDPEASSSQLTALYDRISRTFTWSQRAIELLEIIRNGWRCGDVEADGGWAVRPRRADLRSRGS
jgi:glycosyltransferase involved in cell wall biosynthesis